MENRAESLKNAGNQTHDHCIHRPTFYPWRRCNSCIKSVYHCLKSNSGDLRDTYVSQQQNFCIFLPLKRQTRFPSCLVKKKSKSHTTTKTVTTATTTAKAKQGPILRNKFQIPPMSKTFVILRITPKMKSTKKCLI